MTRTAFITGANRGIGLAIARGLAERGLALILGCRRLEDAEATAAALGGGARPARLDLADAGSIAACGALLEEADVLVNNAAVYPSGSVVTVSEADIAEAWEVNVLAPWRLCKAVWPGMVARGYGRIVNVSSGAGSLSGGGYPGHAAYGITKSALNALTVNLAASAPAGIKVNALCPGWVRTRMGGQAAPRSPEEGADTAIWLATLPEDGPSGGFFRDRAPIPW